MYEKNSNVAVCPLDNLDPNYLLSFSSLPNQNMFLLAALSIVAQAIINFIGTFTPEVSFDALWYHLTLPKLYLQNQAITFFPGWLLYYSAMPRLMEMFYAVSLIFTDERGPKIIHFLFGLLTTIAIYKFSRNFLDRKNSILASLVFYSNLVVGWLSTTAYIDLARTFFEFLTFVFFFYFVKTKKKRWLYLSAVMLGLAISTKLIAVSSLLIFVSLILIFIKAKLFNKFQQISQFLLISLLVPFPWFIFSYIHTGNPVYPLFSGYPLEISFLQIVNPLNFLYEFWLVFTQAADPINPIYIICLPLLFVVFNKLKRLEKPLVYYSGLSLIIWYLIPRTGGGRFILAYFPVISLTTLMVINKLRYKIIKNILYFLIFIFAFTSLIYRGYANSRYLPVIFGKETKTQFLTKYLHFDFGDFYDVDGYFAKNIKSTDKVLVYGIHNLYYVNFPFIHESYRPKNNWFNYVLTGYNYELPQEFADWKLIYQNNITHVKLYRKPL